MGEFIQFHVSMMIMAPVMTIVEILFIMEKCM